MVILNRLAWMSSYGVSLAIVAGVAGNDFSDEMLGLMLLAAIIALGIKSLFFPKSLLASFEKALLSRDQLVAEDDNDSGAVQVEVEHDTLLEQLRQKAEQVDDVPVSVVKESLSTPLISEGIQIEHAVQPAEKSVAVETEVEAELPKSSKEVGFLHGFFKENVLAKVGGILLFLGALFFMQLVYAVIGPVGKLLLGFSFSFFLFAIATVLDRKSFSREARVLYGATILINYLVILSGRYLIGAGEIGGRLLLNETMTFGLLILNTIFAVIVSMANHSRVIMVFSVFMAFVNPFLVGKEMSFTAYTIVAYALAVGSGALVASYYFRNRLPAASRFLLWTGFLGTNLLALTAHHRDTYSWLAILGLIVVVTTGAYFVAMRNKLISQAVHILSVAYLFLAIFVGGFSGLDNYINADPFILFVILALLALISSLNVHNSLNGGVWYNILLAYSPLIITLMMCDANVLGNEYLPVIVPTFTIFYLATLLGPWSRSNTNRQELGYGVLALFLLVFAIPMDASWHKNLTSDPVQVYGSISSAFVFLLVTFYAARKNGMERLYAIASFSTAIILAMMADWGSELRSFSLLSMIAYLVVTLFYPVLTRNILTRPKSLVAGMLSAALYAAFGIYKYWDGASGMSPYHIGISYAFMAMAFFMVSVMVYSVYRRMPQESKQDSDVKASDVFYPLLAIAISFLSLSITYVFSETPSIITAFILFESSVLYYFYERQRDLRVYVAALILMFIGLVYLVGMDINIALSSPTMFIPLIVVLASFVWSLYSLRNFRSSTRYYHDLGHVIGIATIGYFFADRVVGLNTGAYMLLWAIYLSVLAIPYACFYSGALRWAHLAVSVILYWAHFGLVDNLDAQSRAGEILFYLQYFASLLFFFLPYTFHYVSQRCQSYQEKDNHLPLFYIMSAFYAFVISTEYIYFLFDRVSFVITVYWGIISALMLLHGIFNERIRYRTLGLNLLLLTVVKIMLIDVWSDLDNAVLRIFALMLVGTVMIVISALYSKHYGGDLKKDLSFANIMKSGRGNESLLN